MQTKTLSFLSLLLVPAFILTGNNLFTTSSAAAPVLEATAITDSFSEQSKLTVNGAYSLDFNRIELNGQYSSEAPPPPPPPPPAPEPEPEPEEEEAEDSIPAPPSFTPDPGSAQAYAQTAVADRGWGATEFDCLVALWNKESGWRANAQNPSSGAYGIPQALPGSKMASAGADWQTNANTQIEWGLTYIEGRYGSPCGAWEHSESVNWY